MDQAVQKDRYFVVTSVAVLRRSVCSAVMLLLHDVLNLVFAVGAQVFSEAVPMEACETSPEVASDPVSG